MGFERLNGGSYLISSTGNSWESSGTSNSGAVVIPSNDKNFGIIENVLGYRIRDDERLQGGIAVCLYSANGTLNDDAVRRQRRGLAILSPQLELCYRHSLPVICPDTLADSVDLIGVEDARITYIDGTFYIWYCGYNGMYGMPCCAASTDLIIWHKHTPLAGPLGLHENKDHVIFPEPYNGRWWMLHRPWGHEIPDANNYVIRLASAISINGPWEDEGELIRGLPAPEKAVSWVGAGTVPFKLSGSKYLELYHSGCFFHDGYREYDACACVIDLAEYRKGDLSKMVSHRTEPVMRPAEPGEQNARLRIDIVFPMSLHEVNGWLYLLYGAGDTATCAARIRRSELLDMMGYNK